MKIYLLSPSGVPMNPVLFPTMVPTFIANGHEIVDRIEDATVIFLDLHTRIVDYNQDDFNYLLASKIPIVSFDEFDKGGLSILDWPNPLTNQQIEIFAHILKDEIISVHFCRLLNKTKRYPKHVYPYEKGIIHEEELVSADELFNRGYDICFIANSAPQREKIKEILEADERLKCNIILGAEKIPFDQWLSEHRKAKMFITWSAGGWTDERVQSLFSISAQIREDNDQLLVKEYNHLLNCIKLSAVPSKIEINTLVSIVNDKKRLYRIYVNGHEHVKKNYSNEALSLYMHDKIKKHGIQ